MKSAFFLLVWSVAACSDGDPLGGPHGGIGDPYGPNAADPTKSTEDPNNTNTDPMTGGDGGTTTMKPDGGSITGKDSGSQQQQQDSGNQQQMQPQGPTFTQIFNAYLKTGTTGNCGHCHSSCGSSSSSCYVWLQSKKQVNGGSNPALADLQASCLTWYGGNMPPSGPGSYAQSTTDINAWAAAGGKNN